MEKFNKPKVNLEPIYTFLTENTDPTAFAKLLDEFMYDYITMLIRIQLLDEGDKTIHEHTAEFIFHIKLLRDILPFCEKE